MYARTKVTVTFTVRADDAVPAAAIAGDLTRMLTGFGETGVDRTCLRRPRSARGRSWWVDPAAPVDVAVSADDEGTPR